MLYISCHFGPLKPLTLPMDQAKFLDFLTPLPVSHAIRDPFHVYLNKFEFHFLRVYINKTNIFCFFIQKGRVLVLPGRHDGNLKHSHNSTALNAYPPLYY